MGPLPLEVELCEKGQIFIILLGESKGSFQLKRSFMEEVKTTTRERVITSDIKQSRDSSGHTLENNGRKVESLNGRQWASFRWFTLNVLGNESCSRRFYQVGV